MIQYCWSLPKALERAMDCNRHVLTPLIEVAQALQEQAKQSQAYWERMLAPLSEEAMLKHLEKQVLIQVVWHKSYEPVLERDCFKMPSKFYFNWFTHEPQGYDPGVQARLQEFEAGLLRMLRQLVALRALGEIDQQEFEHQTSLLLNQALSGPGERLGGPPDVPLQRPLYRLPAVQPCAP